MNISISKDIEPLSEFRKKSAEFIKRLKKEKQPIILTQHGKSAAVLMDVSEFERFTKKMEMLEDLLEAKQQVEQGKTYSMKQAEERIEKHLSKWT
ncbi:type II toxin-antitoxin system Phd/YefM family antitoxin [Rhodohalobacter sp. SW132]|uniref:type II toxin-antitoxin system Phd/YefM family antitoxin n=1 Tax=Rhodohalobacter sp. SW132 TaxID=2293433 RepID=UPI000E22C863|nr:type II toxin-antitoxin system Phd/YefM family antitoxin [Rhodohalobacter sp. SW132]REL37823.1 type II toxin-antitoxin system Phd/YefM family antitoxin [Rhodohalobacter sp. SW132]